MSVVNVKCECGFEQKSITRFDMRGPKNTREYYCKKCNKIFQTIRKRKNCPICKHKLEERELYSTKCPRCEKELKEKFVAFH